MARIVWTEESVVWLRQIYDYLSERSVEAADKTIAGIVAKCRLLEEHPELGYRFLERQDRQIRIVLYGHYRIAYLIRDASTIQVLGVYHAALDIERLID